MFTTSPRAMADKCVKCKRKSTRTRTLNDEDICTECVVDIPSGGIDDATDMGSLTFGEFKTWMTTALRDVVKAIVVEQLADSKKQMDELKNENKSLTTKLGAAEKKLGDLKTEIDGLKASLNDNKKIGDNNLKYLINMDRNIRRNNIIIFGVDEKEKLEINNEEFDTDDKKRDSLINLMGGADLTVVDSFRLGKPGGDKPRPIKVTFSSSAAATTLLTNSHQLKPLKDKGLTIYVKPDKSKGEVTEFKRLGKEKERLLAQYPTIDPENPRVTLSKGSLKVDGVEVDKYEPVQTLF